MFNDNFWSRLLNWSRNGGRKSLQERNNKPIDFWSLYDEGYTATWDRKTGEAIKKRINAVKAGLITDSEAFVYLRNLDEVTQRKYYDKTIDYHKYNGLIPLEGSYKKDKITTYGLSLFCGLIVQKNVIPPTNMAAGDGEVADTDDYMDILASEQVRYKFSDNGYMNSLNKLIRFQMTFDILEDSFTVKEIGLFNVDTANTGPMISRTTFDPGVDHVYGENYFTASYLIATLSA
ncbi:MAG: hypothetical protein R2685_07790 [Candidatus Nitrosocosmicus sp.]|nr:hypothetical protein [Candidatus Nitrosocosmicus sp.]